MKRFSKIFIQIFILFCMFGLAACDNIDWSTDPQDSVSVAVYNAVVEKYGTLQDYEVLEFGTDFFEHYGETKKKFNDVLEKANVIIIGEGSGVSLFLFNNPENANKYYDIIPSANFKQIYNSIVLESFDTDNWTGVVNVFDSFLADFLANPG